ncbi:MAG: S1C family serine protease [Solirubrobacteraceae bacterium]
MRKTSRVGAILRSHFVSAVIGGLIVAGGMVGLGLTRGGQTETVVNEGAPATAQAPANVSGLSAHDIYQRDAPAVVFVSAKLVEQVANPFNLFHERQSNVSTGSGFLVDRHGDILTAYHVIAGAELLAGVTVKFEDNVQRSATIVAEDPNDDLAVLRVNMHGLTGILPLPLGDSTSVRVGDPTLTIGNPFGVDRTLTNGIVSALQHQIQSADGGTIENVIQVDQPVAAGNSGGPLLDAEGEVIGINSQIAAGGASSATQRLAFAIPIDTADDTVLKRVNRQTAIRVAYLGIGAGPKAAKSGAIIGSIDKDGPAAKYGLRVGDRIVRIADVPVDSISDVLAVVSTYAPGQSVTVDVRRHHRAHQLPVTFGSRTVQPAK